MEIPGIIWICRTGDQQENQTWRLRPEGHRESLKYGKDQMEVKLLEN